MYLDQEIRSVDGHRLSMQIKIDKEFEPELYRFSINVTAHGESKTESLNNVQSALKSVVDALSALGISKEEIFFDDLRVGPEYKMLYKKLENGGYARELYEGKRKIDGYSSDTGAMYEAKYNGDIGEVERVWRALAECPEGVKYRVCFDIEDRQKAKNKLILDGIRAACERACIYAEATRCKLGPVSYIKVEEYEHAVLARRAMSLIDDYYDTTFPLFRPTPVEVSAEALVEWDLL